VPGKCASLLWHLRGELSQATAAEVAGTSRAEFIDELARRRIAVAQATAGELDYGTGRASKRQQDLRRHRTSRRSVSGAARRRAGRRAPTTGVTGSPQRRCRYNDDMADPPLLTHEQRAQAKRWLDTWARVGPILEMERWARVRALTDEDAARDAVRLFELWQPDWPADDGEGLLLHQRVFARARRLP